jgi:hypothetical protein
MTRGGRGSRLRIRISNSQLSRSSVFASEAKQSMSPRKERIDCFVASLLAMTSDTPSPSRDAQRPSCACSFRPKDRGRRECRAPGAPAASRVEKNTRVSHHGHAGSPGIPRAMVLTVSFALSPVTGLFCHRHWQSLLCQLERQRRGVRTTRLRRPLQRRSSSAPSASTASRLTFVTIAKRPSFGTGRLTICN